MSQSFLQSGDWEKFQQSVGHQTFRIDDVLLIKKSLPLDKNYLYAPAVSLKSEDVNNIFSKIKDVAKENNCIFLRIEPSSDLRLKSYDLRQVEDTQPSKTIILDLSKSEDELLANMHQKTRYNIRLAEKKGVKITESHDIEKFWNLMKETTERDKFKSHNREYYEKMLTPPSPPLVRVGNKRGELQIKLYIAEYEGKVLTAGIFVFYNDTATYLHGASTHENKNVMAPYLLHWEMIKFAKKEGYKYYDFYGVDEQKWPGVTRFKKGFGGEEINYLGTFDVVFNKVWYAIYKLVRAVKRIF